jgi:signal peptidase I
MPQDSGVFPSLFAAAIASNKPIRFYPTGISMQPTIRKGDILTVCPIKFREARVGDILVYRNFETQQIIVHRLVKKIQEPGRESLLTMAEIGRNNIYDPPLMPDKCIIARAIEVRRGRRTIHLLDARQVFKARVLVWLMLKAPWFMALRSKTSLAVTNPRITLLKFKFWISKLLKAPAG